MSITSNNNHVNKLQNNKEAQILKDIFDKLEEKKDNNDSKNINDPFLEKYNIRNININLKGLNDINTCPKNRYKIKLQKLFSKKH